MGCTELPLIIKENEIDPAQTSNPNSPDWLHFNAIDYNEASNEIILSSRNLNEFYIDCIIMLNFVA